MFCQSCGKEIENGTAVCPFCGVPTGAQQPMYQAPAAKPEDAWVPAGKDKITCIILALLLGGLGVHNFYLGETKKGVLRLLTCWIGLGGILALIDLIKMLVGSYTVDPDALI